MPKPWERYQQTKPTISPAGFDMPGVGTSTVKQPLKTAGPWDKYAKPRPEIEPLTALKSIPKSIAKTFGTYSYPIRHPIKTIGGIVDLAIGLGAKAIPGKGVARDYEKKVEDVVSGLKQAMTRDALVTRFNEDPVGMATDIAFLAAGGTGVAAKGAKVAGLTRTAKTLGKISKGAVQAAPITQIAKAGIGTVKGAYKGGSSLLRATAGVFPETIKQIKRIGLSKVERAGRKGVPSGVFTQELVPRVQKGFNALMDNVNDNTIEFLKKHDVSDRTLSRLKTRGLRPILLTQKKLKEGYGTIVDRIQKGLTSKDELANKAYKAMFERSKTDMIPINKSTNSLRAMLVQADLMTPDGVLKPIEKLSTTQKAMVSLFEDMRMKAAQQNGVVSKTQYTIYRDRITDLGRGADFENKLARRVKQMMNEEASQVMPELKKVNKMYREKMGMMEENFGKVKESLLKKAEWDLQTRRRMKDLDSFMPDEYKFLDDAGNLRAADELGEIIANYNDPVFIENQLNRFKQYKEPGVAKLEDVRNIYKHFSDKNIADDALAVSLSRDIHQPVVSPFQAIPRKGAELAIRGGLKVHEIGKTPVKRIRDILKTKIKRGGRHGNTTSK